MCQGTADVSEVLGRDSAALVQEAGTRQKAERQRDLESATAGQGAASPEDATSVLDGGRLQRGGVGSGGWARGDLSVIQAIGCDTGLTCQIGEKG